ncbi:uncharacterized protein EKO05_0002745 [Ascochyta rabiei]|uniref:Uncharacterized protein n=1 Tax=Didymella rabiei TaxID=5454 RepID=A0A163M0K1_DIDRA|nr:uncharacterized protein EKO05_0002745 [Ascochyta rabiei]KZM28291.1 hypothetical protein ST47_g564 [Ascochyta rabiei]UPX12179.1 hypothetical protein EKO05_0002745 [Ascochyta rabiei]
MRATLFSLALFAGTSLAHPRKKASKAAYEQETLTLDEIHQAALAEGGVVTVWHGGDEKNQQDYLKQAFEARFPDMTLNITVDLSKYHDTNINTQLAEKSVYVDSVILQTSHNFPRWKDEGALLNYAPLHFDNISSVFKDKDAAYTGVYIFALSIQGSTDKTASLPKSFKDFTKPEYKDKLVLVYPNDDDAILWQFDLLLEDPEYGMKWFDALLANNPRWVRGTATAPTIIKDANSDRLATFTSVHSFAPAPAGYSDELSTEGTFVSWAQNGAILKDAPHPEGAKLLLNYLLSDEYQVNFGWSPREDIAPPAGVETILKQPRTHAAGFAEFMSNRAKVERRRFFYESKLHTAQGISPLEDEL